MAVHANLRVTFTFFTKAETLCTCTLGYFDTFAAVPSAQACKMCDAIIG